ncbi:glutathionylspermidine synthase family protein [Micromonospora chalcea]|uniref:glutathionylspermidine synthase family protein n=1 Tax=Micromonospora chalcea TaxID=1874 RepID=UPI003D7105F2
MRRVPNGMVRPAWRVLNHQAGLTYNDTELPDGTTKSYWTEGAFYDLTMADVEQLETAGKALRRMVIDAVDHIVATCPRRERAVRSAAYLSAVCTPATCLMSKLGIPEFCHEQMIRTWLDGDAEAWTHRDKDLDGQYPQQTGDFSPSVYSRFDLRFAGDGSDPKLLEYNGQTPTSLIESAVVQWLWSDQTDQSRHPERQYNSIHDRLVGWDPEPELGDPGDEGAWRRNIAALRAARPWLPEKPKIFFAYETSETSGEDRMNTAYLQETAAQAGFPTELIAMSQIGHDVATDRMVFKRYADDPDYLAEPIDVIFMLYPWEWLWHQEGAKAIFRDVARPDKRGTVWIEPPYTALWSNKGILAVLWKLFGDKPEGRYLLPAYFEDERPAQMTSYARKPIWGREGANVTLVRDGQVIAANDGPYGSEGFVVQELCELPVFDSVEGPKRPVVGLWLIEGEPAGVGVREGDLITDDETNFTPHTIGSHL